MADHRPGPVGGRASRRGRGLTLLGPALALISAASWGAGDFCGGIAARSSNAFVATFTAQVVGLVAAVLLLGVTGEPVPPGTALATAGLAGASGALGLGCFYMALSRGTMGLIAPLTALIAAAIPAAVGILSGERAGPLILAGMAAALAAVFLIALPDRRLGLPVLPTFHGSRLREWLLIIAAGLGFAGFFIGVDASHAQGGEVWWPLFLVKVGGVASVSAAGVLILAAGRMPPSRAVTAGLLVASLAGVGDLGGNLFFVLASGMGELGVVVVLASLYPLSTALLARLFLQEHLGPLRLAGVGLAIGGVILIGLGSLG